jgi:tetratricopeptide (TPR) repeat protein
MVLRMKHPKDSFDQLVTSAVSRGVIGLMLFIAVAGGTAYFLSGAEEPSNTKSTIGHIAKSRDVLAPDVSPFGRFLAGRFAESQSDLDQAARLMAGVLEEEPDDKRFLKQAFVLAVSAGHSKEAINFANQMVEAGLKASTPRLVLMAQDFKEKAYVKALSRIDDANTGGLGRYALPIAKAWALVGQKKFDEAMTAIDVLGKEKGFSVMYRLHAGLISVVAGKPEAAVKHFRSVDESKKLAAAPVRIQRAALPVLQKLGKTKEALALIDKQLEIDGSSVLFNALRNDLENGSPIVSLATTPLEGLAEGLFNISTALPRDRAGNVVLLYAQLARMLRPTFPLAKILIGDIMMSRERYGAAAAIYEQVDQKSHYGWTARLRKADALYEGDRLGDARKLLEKMGDEQPERFDALLRLGNFLRYKERYKEAVKIYDRAFKRLSGVKKRDWNLFYSRGIALERSKQWERAEKDFLEALNLVPEQPYVLNYLGYSWVEREKNLKKAKKMIESAVAQRRNDGYIVDSMGWVLYRLGEFKPAVGHLERAVQLRPHDPVINDHLGDAYWRVGRKQEARFQWRRALNFKPDKGDANKIKVKLQKGLGKPEILGKDG